MDRDKIILQKYSRRQELSQYLTFTETLLAQQVVGGRLAEILNRKVQINYSQRENRYV